MFTLDKTIIKGDYLIDDDPTPATRTAFTIQFTWFRMCGMCGVHGMADIPPPMCAQAPRAP